jgi:hypothetical protein
MMSYGRSWSKHCHYFCLWDGIAQGIPYTVTIIDLIRFPILV